MLRLRNILGPNKQAGYPVILRENKNINNVNNII